MATSAPTDMTDQVVVIFGSGPGIGSASATVLAAAGATVVCIDRDLAVAQACVARVEAAGGRARADTADVRDRPQVRSAIERTVTEHGAVHHVLDVVGKAHVSPLADVTDEIWAEQIEINLSHHFVVAQEATTHLRGTRGSFVAIGSFNGLVTSPNALTYGVSKAAVMAMVRNFALEYGPQGVRFNVVAPGLVLTDRARELGMDKGERGDAFRACIPMGRLADPLDVAYAVLFLMSAMGHHVTGQALVVDGGSSLNYFLPDL